ncbi:MAG: PAS domain S-box protein [Syntrophomonadaceae bacterium]|nr:PAS domain S-box protein [Syntrophomonadaceae bacterium]
MKRQTRSQKLRINELEIPPHTPQLNQLILDNTYDLITINRLDDLSFEYVNPAAINVLGYSREELFAKSPLELIHPDDRERIVNALKANLPDRGGRGELRCRKKNGTYAWLELSYKVLAREQGEKSLIIISRDITDRKQTETTLQHKFDSLALLVDISKNFDNVGLDNLDEMIKTTVQLLGKFDNNDRSYICLLTDERYTIMKVYEWCAEGIEPEIKGVEGMPVSVMPWWRTRLQDLDHIYISRVADLISETEGDGEVKLSSSAQSLIIVPMFLEDRMVGFLGLDSVRCERIWSSENVMVMQAVAQVITKALYCQKYAQALETSQNYYQTIFENRGAATIIINENMDITMVNDEYQRLLGYTREELIGMNLTGLVPSDSIAALEEYYHMRRQNPAGVPPKHNTQLLDKKGKYRNGMVAVSLIPGSHEALVTFIDLTEFNRINRALKTISATTAAVIHAANEEELLRVVCEKIVEVGGYSLAWVGYLRPDLKKKVQPMAYAGVNNAYLPKLNITMEDPKRGQGPTANAIRYGMPIISKDLKKDETFRPWSKDALRRGFKSSVDIPLMNDGKAFGVLSIYAGEIDAFDPEEQKLLIDMANNLAYAVNSLHARLDAAQTVQKLEKSLARMQRMLMQAVNSLGTALNIKDPYTAGHQKKVVRLAVAIASEMGLSKEQIEGLTVAGNLHDIGKIYVPSEILSKPGKLSELEFAMIKTHCQAGYEIIKEIEFPWPVAEVLLQHHERVDGSGYPQGLKGEEMLLEARIMAVADVVVAMASHRPYRPALGINIALEEISNNRGTLYDPEVVDACLHLFRDKGFKLK